MGDLNGLADSLGFLSMICRESEQYDLARHHVLEALAIARELDSPVSEGFWLLELGLVQLAAGHADESLVSFQRSASIQRVMGDRGREAQALDGIGEAYRELARPDEALEFHRRAASIHRELRAQWQLAITLEHMVMAI